jgi:NADH-quinone oxidoreductase subunit G
MVENDRGTLDAACSTPPRAGMAVKTNTERLRKYRKMILELLLSNHCRDCTTCDNSEDCRLQDFAKRFHIEGVRFPNSRTNPNIDDSSPCIIRDKNKCILCGDCVRTCNETQKVGAIDFAFRGSKMRVGPAFDRPIADSPCVGCGQCAAVCPTGAIIVRNDTPKLWKALDDKDTFVSVQMAPAVRVAIAQELGLKNGSDGVGVIVAALRRMGFNEVFDTSTGADLTVIEEAGEFVGRLESGENLPLFTSCCPAWVQFVEKKYPEFLPNVSTCRSPMEMFASVLKKYNAQKHPKHFHVAVMPCTAKKFEAERDEFKTDSIANVDCVITTKELIRMIREAGIISDSLDPEAVDAPFGVYSGAGLIFGVTGGVTEAVLRRLSPDKSRANIKSIAFAGVRGFAGLKEASIDYNGREVKIAIVSGLGNADKLLNAIKSGEAKYDFVEVMACPGGCVCGAGQPFASTEEKQQRGKGLYAAEKMANIKRSEENPVINEIYDNVLQGHVHEMLHVDYKK